MKDQVISSALQLNKELRKIKEDPSIHKLQTGVNQRMSFGSKEMGRTKSAFNRSDSNVDGRSTDLLMSQNI